MSVIIKTFECYPEANSDRLFLGGFVAQPRHADCPGFFGRRGVMGGWRCPCPCHQHSPDAEATS